MIHVLRLRWYRRAVPLRPWQLAKAAETYFAGWEEAPCYMCDEEADELITELGLERVG